MSVLQSIILSIVQGITEFLPISSSAHLLLTSKIMKFPQETLLFDVMLHVGTLFAILIYFRDIFVSLTISAFRLMGGKKDEHTALFINLIVGTIPVVIVGGLLTHFHIDFRSYIFLAINMLVFSVLMFFCDKCFAHKRTLQDLTLKDSLIIGVLQSLALIPGVSRSGACLTAARYLRFTRVDGARFGMILSVPAVIAAAAKTSLDALSEGALVFDMHMGMGMLITFLVGYMSIHWMLMWLGKHSLLPFVVYRILLGIALLIYL